MVDLQEISELEAKKPLVIEDLKRELANARKVLESIQEVNRRDGVLNEHVLHSEAVAEKLVEKLKENIAILKKRSV